MKSVQHTRKAIRPTDAIGLRQDIVLHDSALRRESSPRSGVILIILFLVFIIVGDALLRVWLEQPQTAHKHFIPCVNINKCKVSNSGKKKKMDNKETDIRI